MGATQIRDLFLIAFFIAAQRDRRAGVLFESVNQNEMFPWLLLARQNVAVETTHSRSEAPWSSKLKCGPVLPVTEG
jgi:hypothetical protein